MAYISIKDVSYEYPGGFLAVDSVNLELEKGENVAIVGQNGAGKTTMVKMLNALLYPTKGYVMIGDMNTKDHTTAQVSRVVGYVFQNPDDQIFHSSVRGEVEYGLIKMKLPAEQIKKQVAFALEITGMDIYAEENPFNLPLSMRKFITIAAIVAIDCPVMVFDEPTAGQDMIGNKRLAIILEELYKRGKTVITISHDMEFVVNNFSRVIVMANKKIIKSGAPEEIFWDFQALEKAMLKQPYVSRLCKNLDINENIILLDQAVDILAKTIKC